MAHLQGILSGLLNVPRQIGQAIVRPGGVQQPVDALSLRIEELERALAHDQRLMADQADQLAQRDAELSQRDAELSQRDAELSQRDAQLAQRDAELAALRADREALLARIAKLEERLNTSSRNSSQPSSQDRPDQRPPRTRQGSLPDGQKRRQGGQPGHTGHHRPLLDASEVTHIEPVPPPSKCDCGGEVIPTGNFYRAQQFELPQIKLEVTEYQLGVGVCLLCGKSHQAALPAGTVPGILGPRMLALVTLLVGAYQISRRGVASVLEALVGLRLSPATMSRADERVSAALAAPYEEARGAVQEADATNFDETGSRRQGKRSWIWLMASTALAVFLVSAGRGQEAYESLIGGFKGWMTSDRWHTYNRYHTWMRQLCWAHLLRDIQKLIDRGGASQALGAKLMAEAVKMFEVWGRFKEEVLTRERFKEEMRPIREAFENLLIEGGSMKDAAKTAKFCQNLLSLKEALWNFVEHEGLAPTNNWAEQLIRLAVMWRKRSFGTWSERGDRHLERLLTTVVSLRLQKRSVLPWLTEAIRAHYAGTPAPSLLPIA